MWQESNKKVYMHYKFDVDLLERFIKGREYTHYTKVAEYLFNVHCPDIMQYINWAMDNHLKYKVWCNDDCYKEWLLDYIYKELPTDAIIRSLETLQKIATKHNIEVDKVYTIVYGMYLGNLVKMGRISPWFLYTTKLGNTMIANLSEDFKYYLRDYLNDAAWGVKIKCTPSFCDIAPLLRSI
jgi:hypothetical protein